MTSPVGAISIEEPLVRFMFEQNLRQSMMMGARLTEGQTKESMYNDYLRQHIDSLIEIAESDEDEGSI